MRSVVSSVFICLLSAVAVAAQTSSAGRAAVRPDPSIPCSSCDTWNAERKPFRLFGNTYYVGVRGLSVVLIASDKGHILIDGALPQSAARIDENLRALGFRIEDVKLIVNSHEHYDHVGGVAALQRASGAAVASSPAGTRALEAGEPTPDDPQYAFGREVNQFPAVPSVRVVKDGETLRVGDLAITAHQTPGHTPGSTTWSWRACEGSRCVDIVYADSLNPVSAPGFRFSGDAKRPSRVEAFRRSIETVERLPCDIIVSVHPEFTQIDRKLEGRAQGVTPDPFVDPQGCRTYAADARQRLDRRVAEEAQAAPSTPAAR